MTIHELTVKSRSYRTFDESEVVPREVLLSLIDTARLCPSARNLQPLKYRLVTDRDEIGEMVSLCKWATALSDTTLPPEGHLPAAFIIICVDTEISSPEASKIDVGIAAQTIMLGASERGLGGCMLGSFTPIDVSRSLLIPKQYVPTLALAIGVPSGETVILCKASEPQGTTYYRTKGDLHFVPKRDLEEILIK